MVNPFNTKDGNKSIVWCIVDNTKRHEPWSREIEINLSDHMIFKLTAFKYDIYIGDDEDELLRTVSNNNYTHAVIIASGTSFTLSDRLFPLVDDICTKDFFVAGHILDRGREYPELHHQFYIVNLPEYVANNMPTVGIGEYRDSVDRILHGYNIVPITPHRLLDIGSEIRSSKKYFYYEYEHVFFKEVPNLYHQQFLTNNVFPAWNTDKLHNDIAFDGPVDQYVTVAVGLNWIRNLMLIGYHDDTTVIFTDINGNCLNFMKNLIEDWDGVDYIEFFKKHIPLQPNNINVLTDSYLHETRKQWEEFRNIFDDWPTVWEKVRKLHFKYILTNYTTVYNFDWIESGKNTLINLSDLFTYTPYVFVNSLKYRISCENRLFKILQEKDPNITIMLTSRAGYGFTETNQLIGKAKDFELTDIKSLKLPSWHIR